MTPRLLLLASLVLATPALADPAADARTALAQWPGKAAFSAKVQVQGETRQGSDATPLAGSVQVDDGPGGLRLTYPPEQVTRLAAEARTAAATPTDQSPPRTGAKASLTELAVDTLRPLVSAADVLATLLARASCDTAKDDTLAGKPARLLKCTLRRPAMSARERDYVKKYEGTLALWLAPDGTPLAAKRSETVSGRAMVVISFETTFLAETTFAVVGDRLVATRHEASQSGSGAGERQEGKRVWTLTLR